MINDEAVYRTAPATPGSYSSVSDSNHLAVGGPVLKTDIDFMKVHWVHFPHGQTYDSLHLPDPLTICLVAI